MISAVRSVDTQVMTAFQGGPPVNAIPAETPAPDATRSTERATLLSAVADLAPVLGEHAHEAEELRTLPSVCVEAMRDAGLFAIATPREVGGLEVDPLTHMEIIEEVARIDTSAGWTLMIGAHGTGTIGTFATDDACSLVFAGPRWPIAGSQMAPWAGTYRRVDGGFVVSGRWPFASGVRHADWSMLTATCVDPDGGAAQLAAILPTSEVTVHDNWHVSGLKGTGSCDYALHDMFIADRMAWPMPPKQQRGGPRYALKVPQATLAVFAMGVARRSLDEIRTQALAKVRPGSTGAVAHRAYFHHFLGEAEMRLAAARAGLYGLVEQMWLLALDGRAVPTELELRLAAVPASVHQVAYDIVSQSYRFAGSGAARLDNVLQRNLRDMAVAAQHMQANEQAFETLGQSLLGLTDR